MRLLELLGPDKRAGEVGKKPCRHEAREPIVENHRSLLLESVAGVGVSDRCYEQAKSETDQDEVQHGGVTFRQGVEPPRIIPATLNLALCCVGFRGGAAGVFIGIS